MKKRKTKLARLIEKESAKQQPPVEDSNDAILNAPLSPVEVQTIVKGIQRRALFSDIPRPMPPPDEDGPKLKPIPMSEYNTIMLRRAGLEPALTPTPEPTNGQNPQREMDRQ